MEQVLESLHLSDSDRAKASQSVGMRVPWSPLLIFVLASVSVLEVNQGTGTATRPEAQQINCSFNYNSTATATAMITVTIDDDGGCSGTTPTVNTTAATKPSNLRQRQKE